MSSLEVGTTISSYSKFEMEGCTLSVSEQLDYEVANGHILSLAHRASISVDISQLLIDIKAVAISVSDDITNANSSTLVVLQRLANTVAANASNIAAVATSFYLSSLATIKKAAPLNPEIAEDFKNYATTLIADLSEIGRNLQSDISNHFASLQNGVANLADSKVAVIQAENNIIYSTIQLAGPMKRVVVDDAAATEFYLAVDDMNDNTPLFEEASYSWVVDENSDMETVLGTVSAFDADEDGNAVIKFTVIDHENMFDVGELTGIVTTRASLDREIKASYIFRVQAADDQARHVNITTIELAIMDKNDNYPLYDQMVYTIRVPENNAPNMLIATSTFDGVLKLQNATIFPEWLKFNITDADTGRNSEIAGYELVGEVADILYISGSTDARGY